MFRTLPKFEYFSPGTLEEALAFLRENGDRTRMLAGGTDLIPQMRWGEHRPEYVMSLGQAEGLDIMEFGEKTGLKLGAMCRIAQIEKSPLIKAHYPILSQAASVLGSKEIRNRATLGGNLCTAAPSADMPPSLLALEAKAVVATSKGERVVPLEEFFKGPKENCLGKDEILTRIEVPPVKPHSGGEYVKFGRRRAMEITMIGVAALLTLDPGDGSCTEARLALATAAPTPIRAKGAEKVLSGKEPDEEIISEAATIVVGECSPRSSWRTTEEYRKELIPVLVKRAIKRALEKVG
ncbi:MAG: xanthine dehydrogenase family protein subunit M [Deltaproteobacteria bacterium]|nr:xanthine dehydrogenase family protein subunit M [Deltaproteobacteria bacterium]MBW2137384.1 xanthine dehydrogenase family protein subunit M [Deltaproteobacteria bacterium]